MKNHIFGLILSCFSCVVIADSESPYAGQEIREIKSLSQQEIVGYLNGRGLGLAKAAELNHFPGPMHVLELSDELGLTEQQIQKTQTVFEAMKSEAVALGAQYIAKERELDQGFTNGSMDTSHLSALLSEIGNIHAKIRYVHLNAHIKQKSLLTQHQIHLYDQLRGYEASHNGEHHQSH